MNGTLKTYKSSKFIKVDNNIFKNTKKLNINKYLKDRKLLTKSSSPRKNRKGRTKSNRNLTNNLRFKKNLAFNFEKKENQNISNTNNSMKRFLSKSKIINTVNSKGMILIKKKDVTINIKGKEEEKGDLTKYFKPELINLKCKRYISSNNIDHLFKSMINNNNNNNNNNDLDQKMNIFKKNKLCKNKNFNGIKNNLSKPKNKKKDKDKDKENVKDNENIKDKENKSKEFKETKDYKLKKNAIENKENKVGKENKGKKNNKLKIINKEKKENNEDNITPEYKKYEKKNHKFKFFCCL
jgi:hypothetical protein